MAVGTTDTNGADASKPFFHTKLFINNEVSEFEVLQSTARVEVPSLNQLFCVVRKQS